MDTKSLEKYSSAITLSDMEVFVFPELMYSLLLANIMSPIIWSWRDEDCFKKLDGKTPYRKLMRLKQFIMDEFEFNLDLNTWGLTNKNTELNRFAEIIPPEKITESNALFGYHGDEYYFDLDIRRHFGLDKYEGNVIPYWKTETVEAMKAFALKDGYSMGAGECVSLSALYAAAAFVVCGIPLEDIYMVLTPLHSQNYIDLNGGVITNNRRLVTKTMWFNGTELSNKAQRAIRNEQITIVAHNTGHIHCMYDEATIDKNAYGKFKNKLSVFLDDELNPLNLANFLRCNHDYQQYFQFCVDCHGSSRFVKAETLFHYEHISNFRIADATHDKLLAEVDQDDFSVSELPGRLRCDKFIEHMNGKTATIKTAQGRADLAKLFGYFVPDVESFVQGLREFLHIDPILPAGNKKFTVAEPIKITAEMSRQQVIDYLFSIRDKKITADLAFYVYRDMASCDWAPFLKAAIHRSPVSIEMAKDKTIDQCYGWLNDMADGSIYDGARLAHPDEVVNFSTGDGIEKAFTLANIIRSRADEKMQLIIDSGKVTLKTKNGDFIFNTAKGLNKVIEF